MRCSACGAELILTTVVPDDTARVVAASTTPSFAPAARSRSVGWSSPDMGARTTACPCTWRGRPSWFLRSPCTRRVSRHRGSWTAW